MWTDPGRVRKRNEDAAYVDPGGWFFMVADGVGGLAAGNVASSMAIEIVRERLDAARARLGTPALVPDASAVARVEKLLVAAIHDAHRAVYARGRREIDKHSMSTTLDVVLVVGTEALVAHVGDSRVYQIRGGAMQCLTSDHTMAEIDRPPACSSDAACEPTAHLLLNALGMTATLTIDLFRCDIRLGDVILLATDGLYGYFADDELAFRASSQGPDAALRQLVHLARHRGGRDNITGVVVDIVDVIAAQPGRRATIVPASQAAPSVESAQQGRVQSPIPPPTVYRCPPQRPTASANWSPRSR